MATATERKTKAVAPAPTPAPVTFDEIARNRLRERIEAYREIVRRQASGDTLPTEDMAQAAELLDHLGLPYFAFERDVQAHREYVAASKGAAEAEAKRPANEKRLEEVTARIKAIESELKALRSEHYTLAEVEPMTRVSHQRMINELTFNHPHVLESIETAVQLRIDAKAKLSGQRPQPAASGPITTWSIG
jgi:hypothetical protein